MLVSPSPSRSRIGPYHNPSATRPPKIPATIPANIPRLRLVATPRPKPSARANGASVKQEIRVTNPLKSRRFSSLHNPMARARRNQNCDDPDHDAKQDHFDPFLEETEIGKSILKWRMELKAEQDLRAQHRHAQFIQSRLRLIGPRHLLDLFFCANANGWNCVYAASPDMKWQVS